MVTDPVLWCTPLGWRDDLAEIPNRTFHILYIVLMFACSLSQKFRKGTVSVHLTWSSRMSLFACVKFSLGSIGQ